tara:strand:- start:2529 stop:2936 length:408 start_codon:yes stop_codon:yes gene_type:complete
MAVFMNNGVVLTVDGQDLSDYTQSVTLNWNANELDVTAMGDAGIRRIKGLEDNSISIDFLNDDAASAVLQTLNTNFGQNVTVTVKNSSEAISASNPLFTMTCLINGITPVSGAVGDLSTQSVTWNVSGTIAPTYS